MMARNGLWMVHVAGVVAVALTFVVPKAKLFQNPELARIIVVHLPTAFATLVFLAVSVWHAFHFTRTQTPRHDYAHSAALELATIFGALALSTGILFSKVQWGAWWQWDPRQTSFLMVMLLLAAGLALRSAFSDPSLRASRSSIYTLATAFPIVFLILVYPRLPIVLQNSFHPTTTIKDGGFDGNFWAAILVVFAVTLVAGWQVMQHKVAALQAQALLNNLYAELDPSLADTSNPPVVRPVSTRH